MNNRTQKSCQICGASFYGGTDCFYCPECAKKKKSDTVSRIRTCKDCGGEFFGGPRSRRCPDCARVARREADKRHKKEGTKRPIGSIDRCPICGVEYIVASGRQKYCTNPECRRKGVLEWQREHKKGYASSSGQSEKKKERRSRQKKICIYCLREFESNIPTNTCSEYCKSEQRKLEQCVSDIKRGRKRNLKRYEKMREECRKTVE